MGRLMLFIPACPFINLSFEALTLIKNFFIEDTYILSSKEGYFHPKRRPQLFRATLML